MSIYDQRDRPAYERFIINIGYASNDYILRWWTEKHDQLLAVEINTWQWVWYWKITDCIIAITPPDVIEQWKLDDPLCSRFAWYNIIMYFAAARAQQLHLTDLIRFPVWKTCPLCGQPFSEDSLPFPLIDRLGIDHLEFCAPCLRDTILARGSDKVTKQDILEFASKLTDVLGLVPPQGFGSGTRDLDGLDYTTRIALLKLLMYKPSTKAIKNFFGSWLNVLTEAGVLEDGTRKRSRGIQTIARDGHVCLSLGEKTIDDWLYAHHITHEKEPKYPEYNFRADFKVGNLFIEFFGLVGDPDYDKRIAQKKRLCLENNIELLAIYPKDLAASDSLSKILTPLLQLA